MEIGLPSLIQRCLENWILDIVFLCSTWISLEASGAVMIVIQATFMFHFPMGGIYNATLILVGRSIGAQQVTSAKKYAKASSLIRLVFAIVIASILYFGRHLIA